MYGQAVSFALLKVLRVRCTSSTYFLAQFSLLAFLLRTQLNTLTQQHREHCVNRRPDVSPHVANWTAYPPIPSQTTNKLTCSRGFFASHPFSPSPHVYLFVFECSVPSFFLFVFFFSIGSCYWRDSSSGIDRQVSISGETSPGLSINSAAQLSNSSSHRPHCCRCSSLSLSHLISA